MTDQDIRAWKHSAIRVILAGWTASGVLIAVLRVWG
jgi:hypothetical protein